MPSVRDFTAKGLPNTRSDHSGYADWEDIEIQPGWNIREWTPEYEERLVWLENSIAKIGVKEPIEVYLKAVVDPETGEKVIDPRTNKQKIVAVPLNGHTRLTAVQRLRERNIDVKRIPIKVVDPMDEGQRRLRLLSSNSGSPLTPLEKASLVHELHVVRGYTFEEISAHLSPGSSVSSVDLTLDDPEKARQQIESSMQEGMAEYMGDLLLLHKASEKTKQLIRWKKVQTETVIAKLKEIQKDDPVNYVKKVEEILIATLIIAVADGKTQNKIDAVNQTKLLSEGITQRQVNKIQNRLEAELEKVPYPEREAKREEIISQVLSQPVDIGVEGVLPHHQVPQEENLEIPEIEETVLPPGDPNVIKRNNGSKHKHTPPRNPNLTLDRQSPEEKQKKQEQKEQKRKTQAVTNSMALLRHEIKSKFEGGEIVEVFEHNNQDYVKYFLSDKVNFWVVPYTFLEFLADKVEIDINFGIDEKVIVVSDQEEEAAAVVAERIKNENKQE